MGLDAYGFVSYLTKSDGWFSISEVYFARDEAREFYRIFKENNEKSFVNRGIPKDSKGIVLSKYLWFVNPNMKETRLPYITPHDAEEEIHLNPNIVFWWNEEKKAIYSTHHFDTWLSSKELDFVANQSTLGSLADKIRGVIGMMKALSEDEEKTRFLLWID
jgi:hypothetical protein